MTRRQPIPRWPLRLLQLLLKKEYLEEIEGDLEELYHDHLARLSPGKARRLYTWEAIRLLLHPALLRRFGSWRIFPAPGLLRNYARVSTRGMWKNPLTSMINLVGLTLAIGFCMLAYGFTRWTYAMDQFHEHRNEVFLVTSVTHRGGLTRETGIAPAPLAAMLKADFPQVSEVCRVEDRGVVVKSGDNVFHERIRCVDPDFLRLFTFPLQQGSPASLSGADNIILSEDMAVKYFGRANPIGRTLLVRFNKDNSKTFLVTGVAKHFPEAYSFAFEFLINFDNIRFAEPDFDPNNWNAYLNATFARIPRPADRALVAKGMEKYLRLHNAVAPVDWAISSFALQPLATLADKADNIVKCIAGANGDNRVSVIFNIVLGAFLLVLACVNYINIAIVTAAKRTKEIGLRRSIGATRRTILVQFLTENVFTTGFSLILGLLIGAFVFIPWFETINHFSMGFHLTDPLLWIYLPVLLLVTALASGIYPSLYISRLRVVEILRGNRALGGRHWLTRIFLGVQLVLACIFITGSVMFSENTHYLTHRSWGYNNREALYVTLPDAAAFQKLRNSMAADPDILSLSGSANHLGKDNRSSVLHLPDRQMEVDEISADADYFRTMGLQLDHGRVFTTHSAADKQTVVVNDVFVQSLNGQDPVGSTFRIDTTLYRVIGVLKEFHSFSFFSKVRPTIFRVADPQEFRYLSMKVTSGREAKAYHTLQQNWAALFPDLPFDGGFQQEVWGDYYATLNVHAQVWQVISSLAIILAALGLYGLVKLNVAGRTKEFSIRKVLGAGSASLASLLARPYMGLLMVALVIGIPVSYALGKWVIEFAYPYHRPVDASGVVIAAGILLLIVWLTIAIQFLGLRRNNPVAGLKIE